MREIKAVQKYTGLKMSGSGNFFYAETIQSSQEELRKVLNVVTHLKNSCKELL